MAWESHSHFGKLRPLQLAHAGTGLSAVCPCLRGNMAESQLFASDEDLSNPYTYLKRVAKAALYCAHRTCIFLSCAFCEQEGHLAAPYSSSPSDSSLADGIP